MTIKWRFIDTGSNNLYINMAIDEALIQLVSQQDTPILRFFDWTNPCISIGFSQRVNDVIDVDSCRKEDITFVRRPTGGGTVFHGHDITYSVVLPRGTVKDIYEGYRLVQSNILAGLRFIGIEANMFGKIVKPDLGSHCFVTPNFGDIIINDKKLCGLAARRIKQKMLYQGYIYSSDASSMQKFCKRKKTLECGAVNLGMLGYDKRKVKDAIILNWPGNLVKDVLNDKEEQLADKLSEEKYSLRDWNCRR